MVWISEKDKLPEEWDRVLIWDVNGYNSHECDIHNHGYYLCVQSQQAKIDAITKQRDSFIKAHHIAMNDVCEHKDKIDELQSRVDEALNTLCKLQYSSGERIYNDVGNILKGNKDEN